MIVIDADGAILGRLSSIVAKKLLMGEQIIIVNAEKVAISGKLSWLKKDFLHKRQRGGPIKGPFYPRYPDMILRRTIRGMLPYKKQKGMVALKRLKVYKGCPEQFKKAEKLGKQVGELECKFVRLEQISKHLGAK